MLRIDNLTYRIGARVLFDGAAAAINPGHRVGLVGRNGTGKTTLLRLITGAIEPNSGTIEMSAGWKFGITTQEAPGGDDSLLDTVLAADRELSQFSRQAETETDPAKLAQIHERLGDLEAYSAPARAARILAGLGFDNDQQQQPCSSFSGGWRMRVALAGLLFTQPDLLLLDEPTNHLDLEATIWLEDYLRRYPGTVVLVSHERGLLNRFAQEILHLEGGQLRMYRGNYDQFEEARREAIAQNARQRAKQDAQRAHMAEFVERFRYKATKAKQAQSRIKQLEKLSPIPEYREDATVVFNFPEPKPLSPPLIGIRDVAVGYDGTAILQGLSLRLDPDDRIGLLGANGNGKSTFIKLLAGELERLNGSITKSGKLRVGYFAQHQSEVLDPSATPIIALGRERPRDTEEQLRSHLGRFGFTQDRALTKFANLSGGEKARLLFALMTCHQPHILLLDEPTNHLDIDTRQALVQAIAAYDGAVVIVSHDPHLLELTADRLWLVDGGTVTAFDGDLDDYRRLLLGKRNPDQVANDQAKTGDRMRNRKDVRRLAAEKRAGLAAQKKRLAKAEAEVERLTRDRERLQQAVAAPDLYEGDNSRLVELQKELGSLNNKLAAAEERWLGLQEEWERAQLQSA